MGFAYEKVWYYFDVFDFYIVRGFFGASQLRGRQLLAGFRVAGRRRPEGQVHGRLVVQVYTPGR